MREPLAHVNRARDVTAGEARLRRVAATQGMKLVKSRRRNEHAAGYVRYWLVDATTRELLTDDRGIDLTEVAAYLEQPAAPTP